MNVFVFRKAAARREVAYHDVCVLQRRLQRFNCGNILFSLLGVRHLVLISYRTWG